MNRSAPRTSFSRLIAIAAIAAIPCALPAQWNLELQLNESKGTKAADISGKANHGTLINFSTTTSPWVKGKLANGLQFDGVDDYIELPRNSGQFPVFDGNGSPFTIAYWLKAPAQSDKRTYSEGNSISGIGFG